eukprot:3242945-Rhodomonas_salina.1
MQTSPAMMGGRGMVSSPQLVSPSLYSTPKPTTTALYSTPKPTSAEQLQLKSALLLPDMVVSSTQLVSPSLYSTPKPTTTAHFQLKSALLVPRYGLFAPARQSLALIYPETNVFPA